MRVIAGTFRGRPLLVPAGHETRPTADRVRESLFHLLVAKWLPQGFDGVHVLDLFCGSGALGIEALSRGAAHATFVDNAADAVRAVQANLASLKTADRGTVLLRNALSVPIQPTPAGLVFCDPPYALDVAALFPTLASHARARSILCCEHDAKRKPVLPRPWRLLERRTWGVATVSIFRLEDA